MKQIAILGLMANMVLPMVSAEVVRQSSYYPEGNAFVCVNGNNRYTRALYGSTAEWRVETSDRPIFATYKKNQTGNIRFRISDGRQTMWLDEAEYCKASYEAGRRDYLLKDRRWERVNSIFPSWLFLIQKELSGVLLLVDSITEN